MKERPLRTTVIGSYPFPGWLEVAAQHLDRFGPDDLATMRLLRDAFDPDGRANPGKVFPTPRRCAERGGGVPAPGRAAVPTARTGDGDGESA